MRHLLPLILILGCGSEDDGPAPPKCDGVLQQGEGDTYDAIFDADGDGFVDGSNPDCQAVYARLDCDDADPDVNPDVPELQCNGVDDDCNDETPDTVDADGDGVDRCSDCDDGDEERFPGMEEVCWDGVDNDCDDVQDEDCGPNYNGDFTLSEPIVYSCAIGTIDIDFQQITVIQDPPYIDFLTVGYGPTPGHLEGELTDDQGGFLGQAWTILGTAAACDEYYQLTGTFLDADHFEGTFEIAFVGGLGCLNCTNYKSWDITGERMVP